MIIMLKTIILIFFKYIFLKCIFLHVIFNFIKWVAIRWNIDLNFFQVNENLKNIYILSNYACYNHNISKFHCEVGLNTISHLQTYF
jgi:hypothetical protein